MKTLPLIAVTLSLCALATAPALARQTSTDTTGSNTTSPSSAPASGSSTTSTTTTTTTTTGTTGTMGAVPSKPMVMQSPDTGKPIYILPPNPTGTDKYKASWLFYNLDDREVKRFESQGYSDSTIKGAGNLALRTGLDVDYILERTRESGYSLTQLAAMYGVTIDNLNADLPGMGAQSYSIASADMYAPTPSYAMSNTSTMSTSTASSASMPTAMQGDIMSVLSADPRFSTLASAIRAAGLTSSLQGAGPYTLFAPTNDAFAKLPAGTLDDLLKPENRSKLSSILLYHVVSGKISGSDVLAMSAPGTPKSLEGDTLTVTNVAPVKVNDANVTATDIQASNGVIHAIDTVLMPPSMATTPAAATTTPTTPAPTAPAPVPNTPAPTTNPTPESPTTPASPGTPTTPNTPTTPAP